ncbi:hypothetical protein ACEN2A_08315 [Corynebacterium auriscanis]|uniref:hypothetical protein n=1 Tax=Corynebacterium auriscanis TaxID=99807 RepID=UPI003CF389D1
MEWILCAVVAVLCVVVWWFHCRIVALQDECMALQHRHCEVVERREWTQKEIRKLRGILHDSRHTALLYGQKEEAQLAEWAIKKLKEIEE